jgi:hypothetical protein
MKTNAKFDVTRHVNLIFILMRESPVDTATGYRLDGWGSIPGRSKRSLLFSTTCRLALVLLKSPEPLTYI